MPKHHFASAEQAPDHPTLGDIARTKLASLADGLALPQLRPRALAALEDLAGPWLDWPLANTPPWQTDVSDDGSPFEFSVAFRSGQSELRMLVEPQSWPITASSTWTAGLAVHERIRARSGVSLARFERIRDMFCPHAAVEARFWIWHAVAIRSNTPAIFKVYLNPEALGTSAAPGLVEQALSGLGMRHAWPFLVGKMGLSGIRCRLLYFSLDLVDGPNGRLKVYMAHEEAVADGMEEQLEGTRGYHAGSATRWLETITGSRGPFPARPLLTCLAFDNFDTRPLGTLHIPIRSYAENDAVTLARLSALLSPSDFDSLSAGTAAMAGRPLDVGRSLITYVSVQPGDRGVGVTTYLAPEAFAIAAPRPSSHMRIAKASDVRELDLGGADDVPITIAEIQLDIEKQRAECRRLPFLRWLEDGPTLEEFRVIAPHLAFFVFAFQDILRLGTQHSTEPLIRELARVHELEDKGHDAWFMSDLRRLGLDCTVTELFSESRQEVRDLSYRIVSDITRASSDLTRLAIVLSLEAIGAEFFSRVVRALQRIGASDGLKYFATSHEKVERAHTINDEGGLDKLALVSFPRAIHDEVKTAVTNTFANLGALARHLDSVRSVYRSHRDGLPK